jgi:hypothetical protein
LRGDVGQRAVARNYRRVSFVRIVVRPDIDSWRGVDEVEMALRPVTLKHDYFAGRFHQQAVKFAARRDVDGACRGGHGAAFVMYVFSHKYGTPR